MVLEEEKMQLTIVLKSEHEDSAPALFSQLEDSQQELGIDDLQVAFFSILFSCRAVVYLKCSFEAVCICSMRTAWH